MKVKKLLAGMFITASVGMVAGCSGDKHEKVGAQDSIVQATSENTPVMLQSSGQLEEGTHFFKYENIFLNEQDMLAKADLVEFFSYGCHHCQAFVPVLDKWKQSNPSKQVHYIPVVWNQQTAIYARVFYALESLPQFNELHHELFEVFESFGHDMTVGDQLNRIYDYVADKGIDRDEFKQTVEGKGLEEKLKNSIALAKHYEITGTPTLIISGTMRVNNKALTAKDDLFVYVDKLLEL